MKTVMNLAEIIEELPIGELTNTANSPFWYRRDGADKFSKRYEHERGKAGDIFYDGNNGDRWMVIAIRTDYKRAIVENKTQGGAKLVFWA
jgi:hypothetical protein